MANIVDPDQSAPLEHFDQGLHFLLNSVCLNGYVEHSMQALIQICTV